MIKEAIKKLLVITFILPFPLLHLSSCKSCTSKSKEKSEVKVTIKGVTPEIKIQKVTYFFENSESIFGYVKGLTDYVKVVSELSQKPEFAEERTRREFYFINGGSPLQITPIGNDPSLLNNKINSNGFKCGDITKSNLNAMFQMALTKAKGDSISILISDGIYDLGQGDDPLKDLVIRSKETQSKFIERLTEGNGNLQTILIKMNSNFDGNYFFSSQHGNKTINQKRPYYIWIFGEAELLNKYFTEKYIVDKLPGYQSMVRFFRFDKTNLPYQATSNNLLGDFKFDKGNSNKLLKAQQDRNGLGFQFDIAVDFSSLPLPDSYKSLPDNYACSGNFIIKDIKKPQQKMFAVTTFTPTHLITVFTDKSPYGILEINLKNIVPKWIEETNSDNEENIQNDTLHTFGFKYLTDGISTAYQYIAKGQNIGSFKIEILK